MEKIKVWGHQLLKKSERVFKTDMIYLAKGGFWTIFSQIIISSSTLLLAIAFAHFVSKDTYGQYKYILSIASILGTFTLTGMGAAVLQAVNRGFEGTMDYAFWKNIVWSIPFFILSLGLSIYYFIHANISLGITFIVIGILSPFFNSTNFYNSYLDAKKDFRRSALYFGIVGNVFPYFCTFIAILLHASVLTLIIVYFASNTFIGAILYLRTVHIYKPNDKVDTSALSYSKHLSLISVLSVFADNIDQILVFHYIGAAELAIYNFAVAIPSQVKGPIKGLAGLIFPKFVSRSDTEIRSGMRNKYFLLFLTALGIIISYIFMAPYIFHIFFPNYVESIIYSQIFSISLLWIVSVPAETYFIAKKKIKEQYVGNILGSVLQIAFLFIGILYGGLLGLVIARVIIKICSSAINIILYEISSRPITIQ